MRVRHVHVCASTLLWGVLVVAQAQTYPDKPIHIIAPASAGSGTDRMARLIGEQIAQSLGTQVIVENRVGGGGTVGVSHVADADPDGYTLLLSTDATIAIQPNLRQNSPRTLEALDPVGEISSFPMVVVVSAQSSIHSISDLIAQAHGKGSGLSYGMGGVATGGHIIGETIKNATKAKLTSVAYPSAARAVTDLMGGHVDVAISDVLSVLPHISADKIRAIAIAGPTRTSCLPEIPTLKEQNVDFDLPYSYGLLATAGTPPSTIVTLNTALNEALKSPKITAKLASDCQTVAPQNNSPVDFRERVKDHYANWGKLIREADIHLD